MKFIGQHIVDLIARFRSLIYLENLESSSDTDLLVVDSDGKVTKNTSTISSLNSSISANTTNISSNDTDISTNATNIATNTSNIATNSSDIAVLQSSSGDSPAIIDSSGTPTLASGITAAEVRSTIGVDAAGTDNSTNVTLAGTPDYITISGQEITRNQIDLTADVTGTLPVGNTAAKVTSIVAGDGIDVNSATGDVTVTAETASDTNPGVVELATTAETTTGTDTTRAVTPDGLKDGYQGSTNVTTLGSITTGVWRGTAIDQAYLVGQSGTNTGDQTSVSGNAGTATALETARNIGGVSFDGTANIDLPGVNTSGNQDTSGNAATATALATSRNIAGVAFNGTGDISLNNNAITNGAGYTTNTGDITAVAISEGSNTRTVSSGSATINFATGEGIDVASAALGGNTVQLTISGEDASTSNKGVASFSSDNFAASSGAISIKSGGVDLTDEVTGTLPVGNGGTGVTDVKQIITRQAFQCNFIDDIGTTKHYLPLAGILENTVRYQDEAAMLAPCDGRVASVTLKMENLGGASGNITFGVEVGENPGTGFAQTWTVVETETFAIGSGDNHDTFHFHFTQSTAGANSGTSKHFDATMLWAISIQSDDASLGGDGGNDERWFVTAVVEWDWSTYLGTEGTTSKYTSVP